VCSPPSIFEKTSQEGAAKTGEGGGGGGFMVLVNNHMYFSALYTCMNRKDKAMLRLVNKELRDAVNLNVRGLKAVLNGDYELVDMPVLILKLPNLASIDAKELFSSDRIFSVLQS
jgi:hypothetical protein